jgi:arylsulfatase A-like enzyme
VTDNGKLRAGKGTVYEGGVRVAACAAWDGHIKAGSTITEPLHMVDWYPTLLKLCGAKAEQKLAVDGLDIWPTLTEGKPSPHDLILINTTPTDGAVRAGDWKFVIYSGAADPTVVPKKKTPRASAELFNLKDDPYEQTNLADKHPEKAKELRLKLSALAKQAVPSKVQPRPTDFVIPKVWGEKD